MWVGRQSIIGWNVSNSDKGTELFIDLTTKFTKLGVQWLIKNEEHVYFYILQSVIG